ncbi:diguanylate cyclase/phosphodiesterase (plasmid) [Burkholderia vietnamiensis G4]|uniref:Diguanylate cyclase/phosphodiesterase n=1 Tax=Burkholderia vietnamiensis (strain G4 / LMG 22486) TaxID=269482 RepID=A4JTT4_BURVG|nr:diguanylate cyclase/phosphodiesterase [Burkholderia vietnamiensis G4]
MFFCPLFPQLSAAPLRIITCGEIQQTAKILKTGKARAGKREVEDGKVRKKVRGKKPKRMIIAVGVMSSFILTSIAGYEVYDRRNDAYREARSDIAVYSATLSRQAADIVRSQRVVISEVGRTLLRSEDARLTREETVRRVRAIALQSSVDNLFLYDAASNFLFDASEKPLDSPPYAPTLASLVSQGLVVEGPTPASPGHISASQALLSRSGRYRWIATSWIDFSPFEKTVSAVINDKGVKVALITAAGRPLIASASDGIDLLAFGQEAVDAWGRGVSEEPVGAIFAGASVQKVVRQVGGAPLLLHVSIDDSVVDARWKRTGFYVAGLTAAGLILIWTLVFFVLRQIDRLIELANRAEKGEAKFLEILSKLGDGVISTDLDGRIRFANHQALSLLGGTTRIGLSGEQLQSLLPPVPRDMFVALVSQPATASSSGMHWDGRLQTESGRVVDSEIKAFLTGRVQKDGVVVTIHDATEQKAHEARLIDAATIDPVTHLSNVVTFSSRLAELLTSAKDTDTCHALLAVHADLAGGLPLAESVQSLAADRLLTITRDSDSLASDGSGRFFVLLRNIVEPVDMARVAQRIIAAYEAPLHLGNSKVQVVTRVGVALFPFDGTTDDALLASANAAASSATMRPYRFANDAVCRQLVRFQSQADSVRSAIKSGHVNALYDPLVELRTGKRIGSLVSPHIRMGERNAPLDRFLSIIEEANLCRSADASVLTAVQHDLTTLASGQSVSQLLIPVQQDCFLSGDLMQMLSSIGLNTLSHVQVGFFVSELFPKKRLDHARTTIRQLRKAGFATYLGDFGVGLASLTELLSLGLDGVIVDHSIINAASAQDDAFAFMTALTSAASAGEMCVIATGVESEETASMLSNMGVDRATGPLFGRALTASALANIQPVGLT